MSPMGNRVGAAKDRHNESWIGLIYCICIQCFLTRDPHTLLQETESERRLCRQRETERHTVMQSEWNLSAKSGEMMQSIVVSSLILESLH